MSTCCVKLLWSEDVTRRRHETRAIPFGFKDGECEVEPTSQCFIPPPPPPPFLFPAEAAKPVPAKTEEDDTEKSAAVEMEGTMRFRLHLIRFDLARLRV